MQSSDQAKKENIEVWEDLVNIKDLVLSLFICGFTSLGGYFLAPNGSTKSLLFGLIGAIIGFLICSIIVKPKRIFHDVKEED